MPPKRKNIFLDTYENEFEGIKRSKKGETTCYCKCKNNVNDNENKGPEFAHCVPCNDEINLTSIGKPAIDQHQKTEKHKKAAKAANTTKGIAAFLPSTSAPTNFHRQIAAAEGTWSYHVAKHALSFKSNDCVSDGLFNRIFPDSKIAQKYSSARLKTAKIISAPASIRCILKELAEKPFSICIDASNHQTTKLFPLVIRFFSEQKGVQVRLLDLESLKGETASEVYDWIMKILDKHGLNSNNIVAFCADNCSTNFGSAEHGGENNLFFKLNQNRANLLSVGCPAHILHNSARHAADNLPIDIEAIIFKLTSHFKFSTKRTEKFRELCANFEADFIAINTHGPTRWTTLENVLDKLIRRWEIFMEYFSNDGPLMLRNFFSSASSKAIVYFLHHVLQIFNESINFLQREKTILPELIRVMKNFKNKIYQRFSQQFYGGITAQLMRNLSKTEAQNLRNYFQEFYQTALQYVEKWFRLERFPSSIDWIELNTHEIRHDEVMELARQMAPELEDSLFDEITELNNILSGIFFIQAYLLFYNLLFFQEFQKKLCGL